MSRYRGAMPTINVEQIGRQLALRPHHRSLVLLNAQLHQTATSTATWA
jgi:hypothetical protein